MAATEDGRAMDQRARRQISLKALVMTGFLRFAPPSCWATAATLPTRCWSPRSGVSAAYWP